MEVPKFCKKGIILLLKRQLVICVIMLYLFVMCKQPVIQSFLFEIYFKFIVELCILILLGASFLLIKSF